MRGRALSQPDKRAFTFLVDGESEEVWLDFGELDRRARAIGGWLQDIGAAGERALLLFPPGLDFITSFFGCLYAGVTAVPLFPPRPKRPAPRFQAVTVDARASLALTTGAILADLESRRSWSEGLPNLRWEATDSIPCEAAPCWREPDLAKDDLAFLQYTSGSTAAPKGVMVTHGGLLHNQVMLEQAFRHPGEWAIVSWLPFYHDMGLIGNVIQPVYLGASCVLMSPVAFLQRPLRWLQAITRYRAGTSGGPNFAYDLCVRAITPDQHAGLDLSSWGLAFNGAEPVRPETMTRFAEAFGPCGFRRKAFYPCYGLAEATLFVTGGDRGAGPVIREFQAGALEQRTAVAVADGAGRGRALVGCGRTWAGQHAIVVEPESRLTCPPGHIGEIWLAGPSVARGYWDRPLETEQTFRAFLSDSGEGPYLRTGDLGFLAGEELFVTGRLKDLIMIPAATYTRKTSRPVSPTVIRRSGTAEARRSPWTPARSSWSWSMKWIGILRPGTSMRCTVPSAGPWRRSTRRRYMVLPCSGRGASPRHRAARSSAMPAGRRTWPGNSRWWGNGVKM